MKNVRTKKMSLKVSSLLCVLKHSQILHLFPGKELIAFIVGLESSDVDPIAEIQKVLNGFAVDLLASRDEDLVVGLGTSPESDQSFEQ
jgi:hypothetical protein